MSKLPVVSGRKVVKAFSKAGWSVVRKTGSHIIMEKAGEETVLSVPGHKEVKRVTLRALIKDAELTVDEFVDLL